jgi:thioredoxin 1
MSYAKYKDLGVKKDKIEKFENSIIEIKSQDHKNQILLSNYLVVIDIYGNFCAPCRTVAPKFEMLAQKYNKPGICSLVKENVELRLSNPPDKNNVKAPSVVGVPMFMFFIQGRYVGNVSGADIDSVDKQISEFLSSPSK